MNNPIAEAPAKAIPPFQQLAATGSGSITIFGWGALALVICGVVVFRLAARARKVMAN